MKPFHTWIIVLLLVAPHALHAQSSEPLTAEDSAALRVLTAQVMLETFKPPFPRDGRIWFGGGIHFRRDSVTDARFLLSDAEWSLLVESYPGARRAVPTDTVFMCRPGVKLRMPGSGCPILDGGIVIELAPLIAHGDSVQTGGYLVQSSTSDGRDISWAQGFHMILERAQRGWRLRAIRSRSVT